MPRHNAVEIPALGHHVVLVDREQMRRRQRGRVCLIPHHLQAVARQIPTPPVTFDYRKNLDLPILGNDRYGCCYYAASAHAVQTWTGNTGKEATFDASALVRRYLQISGGDNGLGDEQIFPEFKGGIVGPSGPHRILDDMTVRPTDPQAILLAGWAFGGLLYTCGLLDAWLANPRPGDVWDAVGRSDPAKGHAMWITGRNARGYYDVQTWGFNPGVQLTPNGLLASDPELIVCFSLEWFNPQGVAPNGQTYDQLAQLWTQLGGHQLPPNPFVNPPPPGPTPEPPNPPVPPPTPPEPSTWLFTLTFDKPVPARRKVEFRTPVALPPGTYGVAPATAPAPAHAPAQEARHGGGVKKRKKPAKRK